MGAPPTVDYVPPGPGYIAALVSEMRDAAIKAGNAKNDYEKRDAYVEQNTRENWLRQKWMQDQPVDYHIRAAKNSDTPLEDRGKEYEFWKGEQMRLSQLIQAECQGFYFITRAAKG